MEFAWKKPVLTIYKQRRPAEREPFAVVKAKKLNVLKSTDGDLTGSITDFFELMGTVDCLTSKEGAEDRYIVCWFDDNEEDQNLAGRRLTGVTFSSQVECKLDAKDKRTYNGSFKAEHGKLT